MVRGAKCLFSMHIYQNNFFRDLSWWYKRSRCSDVSTGTMSFKISVMYYLLSSKSWLRQHCGSYFVGFHLLRKWHGVESKNLHLKWGFFLLSSFAGDIRRCKVSSSRVNISNWAVRKVKADTIGNIKNQVDWIFNASCMYSEYMYMLSSSSTSPMARPEITFSSGKRLFSPCVNELFSTVMKKFWTDDKFLNKKIII